MNGYTKNKTKVINMTLKTLDEIIVGCEYITIKDMQFGIKQEAIKWIKNMESIMDNYFEETGNLNDLSIEDITEQLRDIGFSGWYTKDEPLKYSDETILGECRGTIEWIKHFFNITNKDLK